MSATPPPEFSRIVRVNELGDGSRVRELAATPEERTELARRFGLRSLDRLEARLQAMPEGDGCRVTGKLIADYVQACAATGEDVPGHTDLDFTVRFVRGLDGDEADEELELSDEDCDLLPLEDERIDLGETVAQTLALDLDPYPRAPGAEETLRRMGVLHEEDMSPFAVLKRQMEGNNDKG